MKKKYTISICSAIILIFVFIVTYINNSSDSEELINYAILVDGISQNSFPLSGNYDVTVTCDNATASWDHKIRGIKFAEINGPSECNVNFTTKTSASTTMSNYVINTLYANTAGRNGIYRTNNAEYRYTGLAPNNYIYYNDELWRIIGVFNSNSHGNANQNLVKIINEKYFFSSYGSFLNSDGSSTPRNAWELTDGEEAYINMYLNTLYYNSRDWNHANAFFQVNGLDLEARNMIQSSTWYLGGRTSASYNASEFYSYERSSNVSSISKVSSIDNIGLMYVSDFAYAAQYSCWNSGYDLSAYSNTTCAAANWLSSSFQEMMITPDISDTTQIFYINEIGSIGAANATIGWTYRPTLYLKESVYYISGTGTQTDPFIIGY